MELDGCYGEGGGEAVGGGPGCGDEGELVGVFVEDGIWFAGEACPEICAEVLSIHY